MQQLVQALENTHQERDDMAVWGDWAAVSGKGEHYSPKQDPEPGYQRWSTSPFLIPYFLFSQFCYRHEYTHMEKQQVLESSPSLA